MSPLVKQPDRQLVFNAMAALDEKVWRDLLEKLLPIAQGQALVMKSPATERFRAVVSAELDKD